MSMMLGARQGRINAALSAQRAAATAATVAYAYAHPPVNSIVVSRDWRQLTDAQIAAFRAGQSFAVWYGASWGTLPSYVATIIKEYPVDNAAQIIARISAYDAASVAQASSGGFVNDLSQLAPVIVGAGFLAIGGAAIAGAVSGGAGVTATPGIVAGSGTPVGVDTVATAAVDTGSTLTTTALTDAGGGLGSQLAGYAATAARAGQQALKGYQTLGAFRAAFGGGTKQQGQSAVVSATSVTPASSASIFTPPHLLLLGAAALSLLI